MNPYDPNQPSHYGSNPNDQTVAGRFPTQSQQPYANQFYQSPYSNYQQPQPLPGQSYQYRQPTPPPQPQGFGAWFKRQKRITKFGIGCSALVVFLFACSLCSVAAASGSKSQVANTIATVTQTIQATPTHQISLAPTPTPKPSPTPIPTPTSQPGDTTLGQPVSHFIAKYGQPTDANLAKQGQYIFQHGDVTAQVLQGNNNLVSAIIYSSGNGWSNDDSATAACRPFLPSDATYQHKVDLGNVGYERVYLSPALAPLFSADQFTDENGNNTTLGTIAVVYSYSVSNTSQIVSCTVQIGLQGK